MAGDATVALASSIPRAPIVYRRFVDTSALRLESIALQHGGEPVLCHRYTSSGDKIAEELPLRELCAQLQRGDAVNAKAVSGVIAESVRAAFPTARINALRGAPAAAPWGGLGCQLFLGNGAPSSFTRMHADPSCNLYVMVEGAKRWRFAPPADAPGLVTAGHTPTSAHMTGLGRSDLAAPPAAISDPTEVVLRAGDALVVPPFFFHAVENLGPRASPVVGAAMHYVPPARALLSRSLGLGLCTVLGHPDLLRRGGGDESAGATVDHVVLQPCRTLSHCGLPPAKRVAKTCA
jgi:hypothetical protein